MEVGDLISLALPYGLALSLLLVLVMSVSLAIAPDMWVSDYPPDVRKKYGAMSERARRFRPVVAAAFFGAILLVIVLSNVSLHARIASTVRFADYFLSNFVILMVFNLFDLLVVDWLVFVTIQPKAIVLPGTEGMAGYRDYLFHFRAFLIGTILSAVGAAILAGIALGLSRILA